MRKEFVVGVFVTLALVLFIVGMSYMKGSRLFGKPLILYADYANVQGLVRGNPIMIDGLRIGRVAGLELRSGSGIRVQLEFTEDLQLPDDSRAVIYSEGLLGTKAVKILAGKSSKMLVDESMIAGELDGGMMGKAQALLQDKGDAIMARIDSITLELNATLRGANTAVADVNAQHRIEAILADLKATAASVKTITATVTRLSADAGSIVGNVRRDTAKINASIANAKTATDSIAIAAGKLNTVLANAKQTTEKLNQTLAVLQTDKSSVGKLIYSRDLYNKIDSITANVNSLIDSVKRHPNKYFDVDMYLIERKKKK